MIDVLQGASVALAITLKDNNGAEIDPATAYNVIVELYPETTHEVKAKYSVLDKTAEGYELAVIVGNNVMVYVDETTTADFPIGKVVGKFTVSYTNADFPSGYEVIISRGAVLNVLP